MSTSARAAVTGLPAGTVAISNPGSTAALSGAASGAPATGTANIPPSEPPKVNYVPAADQDAVAASLERQRAGNDFAIDPNTGERQSASHLQQSGDSAARKFLAQFPASSMGDPSAATSASFDKAFSHVFSSNTSAPASQQEPRAQNSSPPHADTVHSNPGTQIPRGVHAAGPHADTVRPPAVNPLF